MEESISLYFTEGSSDKEYHAQLVADGADKFVVNFQYGRRGSALQTGSKTPAPVDYAKAKKVYDKLVAEKTGKGYTPAESGAVYTNVNPEFTGILPQLLNAIPEADIARFTWDPAYCAQEKYDGMRVLVSYNPTGESYGINRKGIKVALPVELLADLASRNVPACLLDGELLGDAYYVFDCLQVSKRDLRALAYVNRLDALAEIGVYAENEASLFVRGAPTAFSPEDKRALFAQVKQANREGVVFKSVHAVYSPGRPASGGPQLKFKFVESATCFVLAVNDTTRSVQVGLLDETGQSQFVGNVTIPPNYKVPAPDELVEVRYLYAFRNGSLYQPVYLGPRADQSRENCTTAQLKYKPEAQAKEAA